MQKGSTYFSWSMNRAIRVLIKAVFLFPLMAITCLPALIFDGLLRLYNRLDDWWWM